jgi:hypothetical protein
MTRIHGARPCCCICDRWRWAAFLSAWCMEVGGIPRRQPCWRPARPSLLPQATPAPTPRARLSHPRWDQVVLFLIWCGKRRLGRTAALARGPGAPRVPARSDRQRGRRRLLCAAATCVVCIILYTGCDGVCAGGPVSGLVCLRGRVHMCVQRASDTPSVSLYTRTTDRQSATGEATQTQQTGTGTLSDIYPPTHPPTAIISTA